MTERAQVIEERVRPVLVRLGDHNPPPHEAPGLGNEGSRAGGRFGGGAPDVGRKRFGSEGRPPCGSGEPIPLRRIAVT